MSAGGNNGTEKDKDSQWYFTAEQLANSPSRRHGIDSDMELSYRQITAYLIQEMGQRLQVLFLAAKVEEQPRKLEHVIKAANKCLNQPTSSITDAYYIEQAQDLVFNENVLLQTLGFDVAIDHPHTHVVKTCYLVKACKDLAQTSYFLASNSLHLTSMCLQYKPTVVACFCIYLACKWSRWEIPQSTEGKHWFHYVDKTVTMDLLKQLTDEFIAIYEKSPARLKSKLNSIKALAQGASNRVVKDKKAPPEEWKMGDMMKMLHSASQAQVEPGSSSSSSCNNNNGNGNGNSNGNITSTSASMYAQQSGIDSTQPLSVQGMSSNALLPPPPPQAQQMRKSDMHSSQHRSHHNSSSHHHNKVPYSTGDVTDHKSSHKQQQQSSSQQAFASNNNMVNRSRDHAQSHQALLSGSTTNSSRTVMPSTSSSSRNSMGGGPPTAQRQSISSAHPLDVNYHHKSRDRSSNSGSGGASNLMGGPPPLPQSAAHSGHKMSSKQQDPNRMMPKDAMGRLPGEQSKSSGSSKMYPASNIAASASVAPPYGGNNQMPNVGSGVQQQPTNVMGHDVSRNMLHNQRGVPYSNSSNPAASINYHQSQMSRQGGSNSNSTSSSKHDQNSKSVHMQPQHHKQNTMPPDALFGNDSLQLQQQHIHPASATTLAPSTSAAALGYRQADMLAHTVEDPYAANMHKAPPSMFSPDWNEKIQNPIGNYNNSSNLNNGNHMQQMSAGGDGYGYKNAATVSGIKESPKKNELLLKKEKNQRGSGMDLMQSAAAVRSGVQQQQHSQMKAVPPKSSELAGPSGGGGIKRSNDGSLGAVGGVYKQEDEVYGRDTKMRKMDANSTAALSEMGGGSKTQLVNGIETNPDLVRSLLKESLCTKSALPTPSLVPPAELLEPSIVHVNSGSDNVEDAAQGGSVKGEKKKKDKHKHKEKDKDKSKDREERKKHKKDKDRHKERERGGSSTAASGGDAAEGISEPVKIKISKQKLEDGGGIGTSGGGNSSSSGGEQQMGFKIKIPKDRIIGDLHHGNGSGGMLSGSNSHGVSELAQAPAAGLKIKISKDKLENYSSGSADHHQHHHHHNQQLLQQQQPYQQQQMQQQHHHHHHQQQQQQMYVGHTNAYNNTHGAMSSAGGIVGAGGGGASKKRERDKERSDRDREKKRNAMEMAKANGSLTASAIASVNVQHMGINMNNNAGGGPNSGGSNNFGGLSAMQTQGVHVPNMPKSQTTSKF